VYAVIIETDPRRLRALPQTPGEGKQGKGRDRKESKRGGREKEVDGRERRRGAGGEG